MRDIINQLTNINTGGGKSILVLAFYITPFKGSEASVSWNYVKEMSNTNRLTVLYGCGGSYLGDSSDIDRWLEEGNKLPNVEFILVKPNLLTRILNWPNEKGFFPMSFHLAYKVWHRSVYKVALRLIKNTKFDLVHYLGSTGYSEQGQLWKLPLPYMRGPMMGFNTVPEVMMTELPLKDRFKFWFRNRHILGDINHPDKLKRIFRKTDVLIAGTTQNQRVIAEIFDKECHYLPENCMRHTSRISNDRFDNPSPLRIIMAGRLDANKNHMLLLKALLKMKHVGKVSVQLVGDGAYRTRLQEFVQENGLSHNVEFLGNRLRYEVEKLFNSVHLHVVTSLTEGNPTVIWEAMEHGVPTLTLDHCGMADVVDSESGIKIPVGNPEEMTSEIAKALDMLVENPDKLRSLSLGTVRRSKLYQWDERRRKFEDYYNRTIEHFHTYNDTSA